MQDDKIERSLEIIRLAAKMSRQYYNAPLIVTYSGGKDSDVLADLAVKSGAEVEFLNSHTTVDAPETVYHIREVFSQLAAKGYKTTIHRPDTTMWKLIPKKGMPPTRLMRYCCSELKETTTPNRYIATGVRADESTARKQRDEFEYIERERKKRQDARFTLEHVEEVYQEAQEMDEIFDCRLITAAKQHKDLIANPIFKWTDADVWTYIRENGINYNPLYDRGYYRVGCIGCPMSNTSEQIREFNDYPKYKAAYIRAFQRMIDMRAEKGKTTRWRNGQEVFDWWIQNPDIPGQLSFEDVLEGGGTE